jgi:predicted nucleic acid-binding protein
MSNSVICVDASLALKLIFPEPDSDDANRLWGKWLSARAVIIAPTLWAYEVTSVIRNRAHRGLLDPDLEQEAITNVHDLPVTLMAPRGLHQLAWQLARQFDRPAAYDAHYLALAEMADALFWTADKPLYLAVHNELNRIRHLSLSDA